MTLYTKNHAFVGDVEFRVEMTCRTALADPEACGNWGLQGFDERTEYSTSGSLRNAGIVIQKFVKANPGLVNDFRIERGIWIETSFPDTETPHLVMDAEFIVEGTIDGYVRDDGSLCYGEEYGPND